MKKINEMKKNFNVIFQHVLREGRAVADYLDNLAFSFAGTTSFQSFHEFPKPGKTLINQDKAQMPYLRIRIAKKGHQTDDYYLDYIDLQ